MQHNNKKVEANKQVEELEQVEKIEGTQDSFKRTLLVNAVIGGAAGLCASKLVGFQEGTVGGLAGGLVFALIKSGLQLTGLPIGVCYLLAYGLTIKADYTGLHNDGNPGARMSYPIEDGMRWHHFVFYLLMASMLVGYANRDRAAYAINGLFGKNDNTPDNDVATQLKQKKNI